MALISLQRCLIVAAALVLSACAVSPDGPVWPYPQPPEREGEWGTQAPAPGPQQPDQPEPSTGQEPQEPVSESVSHHPTVLALVAQADDERSAGDLDRAASTLERAIRIVNDDPLPWLHLAELRYEQGNLIQSENLARRSISYAHNGPLTRQAWLLIADIKQLQGDEAAAREAEDKARGG